MTYNDTALWEEHNLSSLPVLLKRLSYDACGKCSQYTILKMEFENKDNLKYPIQYYYCEMCGWNYLER